MGAGAFSTACERRAVFGGKPVVFRHRPGIENGSGCHSLSWAQKNRRLSGAVNRHRGVFEAPAVRGLQGFFSGLGQRWVNGGSTRYRLGGFNPTFRNAKSNTALMRSRL